MQGGHTWLNPSKRLVDTALDRWNMCKLRADNTSIVTVMLDPPGPPRAQVLRKFHGLPPQISGSSLATPPLPPKLKVSLPLQCIHIPQRNLNSNFPPISLQPFSLFPVFQKAENGEGDSTDPSSRGPTLPSTSSTAVANKGIAIISRFPNSKVNSD